MAALEVGYDLGALALCVVAIALLLAVKGLADALHSALNVGFLGVHPFSGIAATLNNTLIAWLNDAIKGVERVAASFFSGMIDSLAILVGLAALVYIGTRDALTYLWNTGLPARILFYTNPLNDLVAGVKALYNELAGVVSRGFDSARTFAEGQGAKALTDAQAFTTTKIAEAVHAVEGDLSAAVTKLEQTINTATDGALTTALQAVHAAEQAASSEIGDAEQAASSALAQAQALGQSALGAVKSIAVTAEDDLATIEGSIGVLGVAGLIAAIPAIATLVQSIAVDAGLENAECRSKVKGICGSDPVQWGKLLGSLALLSGVLDFGELVALARPLVKVGADIARQAA